MRSNGYKIPNPDWLQRLWTRQEAQYATAIAFHGVASTDDFQGVIPPHSLVQVHKSFGKMMQLATSMVIVDPPKVITIFRELVAARGTIISELSGWQRQQRGGMHMAVKELRAARRKTSKPADYVLALFPTFDWYRVPQNARNQSVVSLLDDAICQFETKKGTTTLFPTMDGIFGRRDDMFRGGLNGHPQNTFDVYCCLTTIGHWERNHAGNVGAGVNEGSQVEVVEWDVGVEENVWKEQVDSVCIHRRLEYDSLERWFAYEALEEELTVTGDEIYALREYVLSRNPIPLAKLPHRDKVIEWITCIHLVISHAELRKTLEKGGRCVRAKTAERCYPALVAGKYRQNDELSIYVAPTTDLPDAGIAWLGCKTGDTSCHLMGSVGGFLGAPSALRTAPALYAANGWWKTENWAHQGN
jgi:hypothetical protein